METWRLFFDTVEICLRCELKEKVDGGGVTKNWRLDAFL